MCMQEEHVIVVVHGVWSSIITKDSDSLVSTYSLHKVSSIAPKQLNELIEE